MLPNANSADEQTSGGGGGGGGDFKFTAIKLCAEQQQHMEN